MGTGTRTGTGLGGSRMDWDWMELNWIGLDWIGTGTGTGTGTAIGTGIGVGTTFGNTLGPRNPTIPFSTLLGLDWEWMGLDWDWDHFWDHFGATKSHRTVQHSVGTGLGLGQLLGPLGDHEIPPYRSALSWDWIGIGWDWSGIGITFGATKSHRTVQHSVGTGLGLGPLLGPLWTTKSHHTVQHSHFGTILGPLWGREIPPYR